VSGTGAHSPALTGVVMPEGHDAIISASGARNSTCRWNRPEQDQGQGVPDRHIGTSRSDADGHAVGVEMGLDLAKVRIVAGVLAAMEVLKDAMSGDAKGCRP